jgi:hypothetical protein
MHYCDICGRIVGDAYLRTLELSFKTNLYYKKGKCPPEESQGCFDVGIDCYRKELAKTRLALSEAIQ